MRGGNKGEVLRCCDPLHLQEQFGERACRREGRGNGHVLTVTLISAILDFAGSQTVTVPLAAISPSHRQLGVCGIRNADRR